MRSEIEFPDPSAGYRSSAKDLVANAYDIRTSRMGGE
jgi:hypothetical protein